MQRTLTVFASLCVSLGCTPPVELAIEEECNPLASSEECLFPYPSRFFETGDPTSATGVRLALHPRVLQVPAASPPLQYAAFNRADGHPPSAPLLVHLGFDVDAAQLVGQDDTALSLDAASPIALFDLETGARVPLLTEMDENLRDDPRNEGRHALILRPMIPMETGHRHVAVLTTALRDASGAPITPPAGFAALRDRRETTHAALEAMRPEFEDVFDFLGEHGYPRDSLLLAWDFTVASEAWVLGGILSMREQALAVVARGELGFTIERVMERPNANVLRLIEGTFEVPSFLGSTNEITRTAQGGAVLGGERPSFPFTMVIPARAANGEPLPLVVFGHGVFGTGRDYLAGDVGTDVIQPLAEQTGAVVIATDWIGLSSNDRELIVTELVADINRVNVITDRLQQALVNNLVLAELARSAIQNDPAVRIGDGPLLTDRVHYYGVSLGGIQGSSLVALSPRIEHAVLAVPGGAWSTLLTRSIVYGPVKDLIDLRYPDALLQQTFITLVQARFDGSDGVNVGQLMFRRPLAGSPDRRVILQEAIGDCQVPNLSTRILARAIGVSMVAPAHEEVFGLEPIAAPTTAPVLMQLTMPDRLSEYSPPRENRIPLRDNGTHSNAIQLDGAIEQVTTLLRTGTVENPCNGACDPD